MRLLQGIYSHGGNYCRVLKPTGKFHNLEITRVFNRSNEYNLKVLKYHRCDYGVFPLPDSDSYADSYSDSDSNAVADPGFPRAGQLPRRVPTYDFAKISQKLHEIERIWAPQRGARPSRPP